MDDKKNKQKKSVECYTKHKLYTLFLLKNCKKNFFLNYKLLRIEIN